MEQHSEPFVAPAAPHQPTSSWYRAATLHERIASWTAAGTAPVPSEKAEKRLQRWKTQKPFATSSFLATRLAMDGITEQDLLALLSEPLKTLQERLSHPTAPDWVRALTHALHADPAPAPVPEVDVEQVFREVAGLRPFYPLLQQSIAHLQTGIEALAREYRELPFDPTTLLSLLLPNLLRQLQTLVDKTLVLELNIARLRGCLHGETSEVRFQDYLHTLCQREHLQPLLEEYCVLARHILESSQHWANCSLGFVQRLCADWPEILSIFAPDQEPGVLTKIAGDAGDRHRGGQSVMILTFRSGWQLVYKPKSLTVDMHFQELLAWLNERGLQPAFRLLKLVNKGTHGWTEWIAVSGCSSEEEVARFYERQGGYLALLYVLEATDFHYENVIAAGEHPLLIDLEALFHAQNIVGKRTTNLAQQSFEHSVLHSLLLPQRVLFNEEGEGIDVGGLDRRIEGQLSPHPAAVWDGAGTDEMRLVHKRVELHSGKNCPRLHDQQVDSLDYIESLIKGFTHAYRLLMTERDRVVKSVLPLFTHDEIRFLPRSTSEYTIVLAESFHPNLLRDALDRERFFDRLWLNVESRPFLTRLIAAERADLLCGDIPLFTTRPDSRDLWTSRGECLPAFFAEAGLELVNKRFQQLSEADLQQQIWFIRASFANAAGQRGLADQVARRDLPLSAVSSIPDGERLLAEARAIGDRLYASALQDEEGADWFGLTLVGERVWLITPTGLDLYSGLPGILLFLSQLGQITGEACYTALAQAALKTLRTSMQRNQAFVDQMSIGAFTGLGSLIYLFSHLAALWNDPALLKEAEELAQPLVGQIEKDEQFDLVDGAAGCLASLLSLHALAPSDQTLKMAMQCGEHLLAHAQPMQEGLGWKARQQDVPLSGFSHGAAGIAWSLLRVAAISGEKRFRDAALAALTYERSLFSPEQRNWLDLRKRPTSASPQPDQAAPAQAPGARCGMSWSHGVPGIALGRLVSLPYLDDATMRTELELALETTIADGFGFSHEQVGPNHSLAHGDCGNLETVLLAAQTLQTPQLHNHLQRLTAQLLESMLQHGWVIGVPLNVETPGLLLGLAGIGYQCLRLAEPERVPSVLTLASPTASMGVYWQKTPHPCQKAISTIP